MIYCNILEHYRSNNILIFPPPILTSVYWSVSLHVCGQCHSVYLTDVGADASLPEALAAQLHCHLTAHRVLLPDLLKSFLPKQQAAVNY